MSRKIAILAALVVAIVPLAGCGSAADTVSRNISKDAEQFRIERRIVVTNGITDKVEFLVEGRCSYETPDDRKVELTCKEGPHRYAKHVIITSDNVFVAVTQLGTVDESEYHTKFIIRPESIVPGFDLVTGNQP